MAETLLGSETWPRGNQNWVSKLAQALLSVRSELLKLGHLSYLLHYPRRPLLATMLPLFYSTAYMFRAFRPRTADA
jgi:hypothetical protein